MPRPPQIPPEKNIKIVLYALAGTLTIAEAAARTEGVAEVSISRWRNEFLEPANIH